MADIYGSTLDSLMQNRVAQQQADAAEENSYRNYLAQMANTNLKRMDQQETNAFRWGDLGVRRQLGNRQADVTEKTGLAQSKAYSDVGLASADAHKTVGLSQADAHKVVGLKNAEAFIVQANNILEASKYGSDAQKEVAKTHAAALMAQAAASERAALAGSSAQRDVGLANAGAHERAAALDARTRFDIANLMGPLYKANAELASANAKNISGGGLNALDQNTRMLVMDDYAKRQVASGNVPVFQSAMDAEVNKILEGNALGGWWKSSEFKDAKHRASLMPGGATDENILRAAKEAVLPKVFSGMKAYGADPTLFSYDPASGKIVVKPSAYQSLLGGQSAGTPTPTPAPPVPAPAPGGSRTNVLDSITPPPTAAGTTNLFDKFQSWKQNAR